jgi:hypothetical protein
MGKTVSNQEYGAALKTLGVDTSKRLPSARNMKDTLAKKRRDEISHARKLEDGNNAGGLHGTAAQKREAAVNEAYNKVKDPANLKAYRDNLAQEKRVAHNARLKGKAHAQASAQQKATHESRRSSQQSHSHSTHRQAEPAARRSSHNRPPNPAFAFSMGAFAMAGKFSGLSADLQLARAIDKFNQSGTVFEEKKLEGFLEKKPELALRYIKEITASRLASSEKLSNLLSAQQPDAYRDKMMPYHVWRLKQFGAEADASKLVGFLDQKPELATQMRADLGEMAVGLSPRLSSALKAAETAAKAQPSKRAANARNAENVQKRRQSSRAPNL